MTKLAQKTKLPPTILDQIPNRAAQNDENRHGESADTNSQRRVGDPGLEIWEGDGRQVSQSRRCGLTSLNGAEAQ